MGKFLGSLCHALRCPRPSAHPAQRVSVRGVFAGEEGGRPSPFTCTLGASWAALRPKSCT